MNRSRQSNQEILFKFQFIPRKVVSFFSIITAILIMAHFSHLFIYYKYNLYFGMFDLNCEENVPTFYSSFVLLFCSFLLCVISIRKHELNEKYRMLWVVLCLIFLFLAFDEYFRIHDSLREPVRNLLQIRKGSIFYFAWVLPYGILLIVFGIGYIGFLIDLPGKYRTLFIISGLIYVTGALVFEMIGATRAGIFRRSDYLYAFWTSMEEACELLGLMFFIYTLMNYITDFYNGFCMKINCLKIEFFND